MPKRTNPGDITEPPRIGEASGDHAYNVVSKIAKQLSSLSDAELIARLQAHNIDIPQEALEAIQNSPEYDPAIFDKLDGAAVKTLLTQFGEFIDANSKSEADLKLAFRKALKMRQQLQNKKEYQPRYTSTPRPAGPK